MDKGQLLAAELAREWVRRLVPGEINESKPEAVDLTAFKRHIYRRYRHAPHLDLLDRKLEAVTRYIETSGREGIGRLIISMPPRHGKTMTTSKLFPAWFLGRNPDKRVMLVSYGQSLANKNSRAARNFVNSKPYQQVFPAVKLAGDSKNVLEWEIANEEGGVTAIGILGAATGKGAHLLLIDDPHKNRAEAESPTLREKVWTAFQGDLLDRLEPGGAIIIMATRWHQADLTGRAIKELEHEGWAVLNLPALAHENDLLGRKPGEPLWAWRYDREALLKRKRSVGPYEWSAKYDGDPKPSEGGIFKEKWFKPYRRVMPARRKPKMVRYWDLAMSEKESADYTVGVLMALGGDDEFYILDVARAQKELADLPAFLIDVMLADGQSVKQGFENKGYMTRAVQDVVKDSRLRRHDIKGYNVDTDKFTRALPFAARAALDVVHVVVGVGGMSEKRADEFVEEMKAFPNGEHDDQVDGAAGAFQMVNEPERKKPQATTQSYI